MSIHFVVPSEFDQLIRSLTSRGFKDYPYWVGGRFNWAAQSYLVLREYREGMSLGTEPMPRKMNFAHVMCWRGKSLRVGEFRISSRADYPRLFDVDFEVLQNPAIPTNRRQAYLPYWPVPGLIPRKAERRGVQSIAYAGRIGRSNIAESIRVADDRLLQYDFQIIAPNKWHDLSEVDVLLAIRSFDKATHDGKPPSKLFSAWRAGVPLIAGYDSAFSEIGAPGIDYIRVESEEQLHVELERLAVDQCHYDALVKRGRERAPNFSHEAIAEEWLKVIDRRIAPCFDGWLDNGGPDCYRRGAKILDNFRDSATGVRRIFRNARKIDVGL